MTLAWVVVSYLSHPKHKQQKTNQMDSVKISSVCVSKDTSRK